MTWSYSGDPSSSTRDAVRFEIGDTDQNDQLLQDGEIDYAIQQESNLFGAAARCCEAIARKFAREADRAIGKTRVAASQKSQAYTKMALQLRKKASGYHLPYASGLDEDPTFVKGMMDNNE